MPRSVAEPPFPNSPESWLACYRYRRPSSSGTPTSPEEMGELMGVSGATVRRWESGRYRPSIEDLQRFAEICHLSPLEAGFLRMAFRPITAEAPPDPATFGAFVQNVLTCDSPAFVIDSFFYPRAWNSLATYFLQWPDRHKPVNLIRMLFGTAGGPSARPGRLAQMTIWISHFWLSSAYLCGSRPYKQVLEELCRLPSFEERWRALASGEEGTLLPFIGAPYEWQHQSLGRFRVVPSTIYLPPPYHMRLLLPLDETARQSVIEARKLPFTVTSADRPHWAS